MKLAFTLLLFTARCLAQNPTVSQLVGTWKLVSVEETMTDGRVQPSKRYGPHPQGFLMYEPDGHMCATLVNGDRPAWKDESKPTDAEKLEDYDTLTAYCGTYKLDSATSTVTHYPEVHSIPRYVGSTQPRPFKLEGNRLIITITKGLSDPNMAKSVLIWQRAK